MISTAVYLELVSLSLLDSSYIFLHLPSFRPDIFRARLGLGLWFQSQYWSLSRMQHRLDVEWDIWSLFTRTLHDFCDTLDKLRTTWNNATAFHDMHVLSCCDTGRPSRCLHLS